MTWLLLACTWPDPGPTETGLVVGEGNPCRLDALVWRDPGGVSVLEWSVDGLAQVAEPTEFCSVEGQVDLGLALDGAEAWVTLTAEPGVHTFPGGDALVSVLVDSAAWTQDDLYLGTLTMDASGAFQGEAAGEDGQLSLELAWTASP